ncbi:uncharacterized protein BDW43DRAFT_273229 [Aspergillus alliaceus]|uniref:uncharacterized protein n=1 Tax=Petromyces alliaceus TaxID=209559 RepID=UPI0012A741C8|nr:uncharacterized protein BDW43DRAFT_273229 [Aspergillus alliaceus]KAB8234463.1 hypothetical protein BDW43DRAFT_273229 [Aspergillus alliaceus]
MNYIFLLWTLLPLQTLGYQDTSFVPGSNERLKNLTGLSYYLYPWVGSYYNGTTTFHLEYLMDNQGDSLCRTFRSEATSFTSKSILAVTKPSPDDDSKNPVRIALKSALTDFDFVNNLASGDESKHLQWQFLSIRYVLPRSHKKPLITLQPQNLSLCTLHI